MRGAGQDLDAAAERRGRSPVHRCAAANRNARAQPDAVRPHDRRRCRQPQARRSGPDATAGTAPARRSTLDACCSSAMTSARLRKRPKPRPDGPGPTGRAAHAGQSALQRRARAEPAASRAGSAICSSVGRRSTGSASTGLVSGPGRTTCAMPYSGKITLTARDIASQRFQQTRQQRGRQLRTIGVERVEHLGWCCGADHRRPGPRRRRRWRAGTPAAVPRRNRREASGLDTARRRRCDGVSPRPAGAAGSTDGICSSPSSRSTSSTRSAGCTRSGRQLGGVDHQLAVTRLADRRPRRCSQSGSGGARRCRSGYVDTGDTVGQVDIHADRLRGRHRQRRTSVSAGSTVRRRSRPAARRRGRAPRALSRRIDDALEALARLATPACAGARS